MKKIADNLPDIVTHLKNEIQIKSELKDSWLVTLSFNQSKIDFLSLKEETEKLGFDFELNEHIRDYAVVRLWKNKPTLVAGEMLINTLV